MKKFIVTARNIIPAVLLLISFLCFMSIGAYGQTSDNNCDSSATVEATLTVDAAAHDGSFESAGGLEYFQIAPASDINVEIETTFTNNNREYSLQLCDSNDDLIASTTEVTMSGMATIQTRLRPGTYYIVVRSSGADSYRLTVATDTDYNTLLSDCRGITTNFTNDPLYGCQWHLKNTGQLSFNGQAIAAGEDINIEGVWNDAVFGNGINVAVVDNGMDPDHEDLAANVNPSLNRYYSGNRNVFNPSSSHGTQVAGIIAGVGDNQLGVRGVAPQASIYSYNLAGNFSDANAKDAMTRNHIVTAVSSNNWGPEDIPVLQSASAMWEEGVETGIREGFGGKGVFYVWAAGDGYDRFRYLHDLLDTVPPYGSQSQNAAHEYDQANFDEYSNYYAVTTVCSVDGDGTKSSFSEEGVNLWVCAPGLNITTTDNKDRYALRVSGTSYSAAQVSGVAALMREANGDLSWRDLKLILAASARQNDVSDPDWEMGALKYGSDTDSYNYNPKYGFGVVDAEAAVELAGSWDRVGAMATRTFVSEDGDTAILDHTGGTDGTIVSTLTVPDSEELSFMEFAEVELVLSHTFLPDLNIQVTSPAGTVSQLVRRFVEESSVLSESTDDVERVLLRDDFSYTDQTHRFGSARHLGEDPAGEWSLNITDTQEADTGTLHSWSIKVYGHKKGDTIPDFGSDTIGDREYIAGSPITSVKLPKATGGNGTLTYVLTPTLPTGLSFAPATRVISGLPTTAAPENTYTYTVTDEDGDTDDLTFGITILADAMPTFSGEKIDDQEYIAGIPITPVTLPGATGGNGTLTYRLNPLLPDGFIFNSATRVLNGTPTTAMSKTTYTYTVTDKDRDTAALTFGITILADIMPDLSGEKIADQEYIAGSPITPVELPEAAGGNAPLTYSITPPLPTGLDFDPDTRVISGTPTTAASRTAYTYTVTDEDGDTDDLTFGITIAANEVPGFSDTIDDQEYIAGTATNLPVTLPEAAGGNAPLTYSITPPLPTGLDFDPDTRVISGTPTTAASRTAYTYTVTDEDGDTDDLTFGITIAANEVPGFSDTIDDQEYIAGTATNLPVTLPEAAGGNAPLTYSITPPLPTGLDFDPDTRVISGTPTTAASRTAYTYTVTDEDGDTDDLTFGITIAANEVPGFSDTIDDQEYVAGTATNLPVTLPEAAGGNAPLTYSITPPLPTGLDFDPDTRVISGTPTTAASRTAYTYTVTDEDGDTDDLTFGITIAANEVPGFSDTIDDQEYIAGTATNLPVTLPEAAGGNAPLTYSITPPLPTGLDFDPDTRVISGTPTTAASRTAYTYTVTDEDGDTDDLTFGITIAANEVPGFSDTIDDQEYIAGTATNLPVTLPEAAGGNAPLTYSITPPLPTGLDFDPDTRVISGTPTTAASRTAYTYTVTDEDGDTDDLTFGITIAANEVPGFSDTIDDQEYVAGTATNLPVTLPEAAGGNAPLTYSITPPLPTGLDFDPDTRVISGTPTTAASRTAYTYTVTDEDGDTDDLTFGITIAANEVPGFSDTIDDQEYIAGTATNLPVTLPEAAGGNAPLTYSITPPLPTGLDFDPDTRVISGTPTTAASRTAYTYTVTDEDGDTDDLTFGITIAANEVPGFSDTIDDQEYIAGTATNLPVTLPEAAGGNAPLTYSITPPLPTGLDFDPDTRVISGTPTTAASRTAYTYTVTDEDGDTDDLTFGITIAANEVPGFSDTIDDQEYIAGTATNLPVTLPEAAGGNAPLTYSITPPLPTGLDFDPDTRVISGTPTTAASRTAYTYTVTDEDGDTDDLTFGITIAANEVPGFSDTIDDQEYIAGTATNLPVTLPEAAGGNAPLTYSITPPLPTGLDFDPDTRVISGTPTTAASRTAYTYTVTDEDGDTDDLTFGIRVVNRPPDTEVGGGGGGCAVSEQSSVASDILGVMACLMLIPVSVVIRRKRRSKIKTWQYCPFKGT